MFLEEQNKKRAQQIKTLGLKKGDFVKVRSNDVWREVDQVWMDDDAASCTVATGDRHKKTEYTFFHDIDAIHRKDDPWYVGECMYLALLNGDKFGGRNDPCLPYEFCGTGPLKLVAWAFQYRRYAYPLPASKNFKNPVRQREYETLTIEQFAQAAGIQITNIPKYGEAFMRMTKLRQVKFNGWKVCVKIAQQHPKSSVIKLS